MRWKQKYLCWHTEERTKELEMVIEGDMNGKVVRFKGGPTGFESYYVNSIFEDSVPTTEEMCICAGTINKWAKCYVNKKEVMNFIMEYKTE